MRYVICAGVVAAIGLVVCSASAYNPPEDTVGNLHVRIEGPATVAEVGRSIEYKVIIENGGSQVARGDCRVQLIDAWTATPGGKVPFTVAAGKATSVPFKVSVPSDTYAAHYPVHAWVSWADDGTTRVAHPILVVKTDVPRRSISRPTLTWRPESVHTGMKLDLWQLPRRRALVCEFNQPPRIVPFPGSSITDPLSHATTSVGQWNLQGTTRAGLTAHPPWFDGHVGTIAIEFPLALPADTPAKLTFANAMAAGGQSDGVTFRVRVADWSAPEGELGEIVFERHSAAKSWLEGMVDLSQFAGRSIRLQLESHPGPKNNTGWDSSFWGTPAVTVGTLPPSPPFPPIDTSAAYLLGQTRCGENEYTVRVWPGPRGLLDAIVGFKDDSHESRRSLYLRGFEVTVLGMRIDQPGTPIHLASIETDRSTGHFQVRHRFESEYGSFDLIGGLQIDHGTLRLRFQLDHVPHAKPWLDVHIEELAIGGWSQSALQVYGGQGNVLRNPSAYRLPFDGHRLATSHVGYDFQDGMSMVEAVDVPPLFWDIAPERNHLSLHAAEAQTRTLIPSNSVWDAVKVWRDVNGLQPADGVAKVAGRFVFDLWGGRYGESDAQLQRAFQYGLTDAMVIWHNWQRWGYDYRLPEIYPPNPRYGTPQELAAMAENCRSHGVLFALHDNYIDYYPDAAGFSYEQRIAFRQDGTPIRAWLNKGRDAQSYRYRADCVAPILKDNLRLIRDGVAPTAYFIDVWSSIRPYEYWTADGQFRTAVSTRDTWRELFAWIRGYLGGNAPQISESGHDQLIGYLDGAQANHLRVGKPLGGSYTWAVWNWDCAGAERTPWFDAAHHDRFVLHGAGYESRYLAGLDRRTHGMYSDDYVCTEVLDGHPSMVSRPFGPDVVRKYWLTHNLMRALALRHIDRVEFVNNDLHTQHVSWSDGGDAWVNRGPHDWVIKEMTLPEYGMLARAKTPTGEVSAFIACQDGQTIEGARAPNELYFNARRDNEDAKPVDFGEVTTVGACRLTRDGASLVITLLPPRPATRPFDLAIRWPRLPWKLPRAVRAEVIGLDGKETGVCEPLRSHGDVISLTCHPDVMAYRLVGQ